jgi:hypothetical protein
MSCVAAPPGKRPLPKAGPVGARYAPGVPSLSLDDFTMDTSAWTVNTSTPLDRSWYDEHRNAVRVRFFDRPCPETTAEGWRSRGARETAEGGGVVLSFDEVRLDDCPAFRGVFKFPATKCVPGWTNTLSVYVVGMIALPLGCDFVMINTEALERDDTGTREAVFGVLQPPSPQQADASKPGTMDDYFDRVRECLALQLPSDVEEFDDRVPWHPLSCVRRLQRHVLASARLSPEMKRRTLRSI